MGVILNWLWLKTEKKSLGKISLFFLPIYCSVWNFILVVDVIKQRKINTGFPHKVHSLSFTLFLESNNSTVHPLSWSLRYWVSTILPTIQKEREREEKLASSCKHNYMGKYYLDIDVKMNQSFSPRNKLVYILIRFLLLFFVDHIGDHLSSWSTLFMYCYRLPCRNIKFSFKLLKRFFFSK